MYPNKNITDLWITINRVQRGIYRSIDTKLKQQGLPALRWYDVLWELERSKHGLRPFELENKLIFEQSNLSRLLKRIIGDGLAQEVVSENDKRGKVIQITAEGIEVRKKMWCIYGPLIQKHMGEMIKSPKISEFTEALNSLIE